MKLKSNNYLNFELRKDMEKHGFALDQSKKLVVDGKDHPFFVTMHGKRHKAYYCASCDSFGEDKSVLIGCYGLENSTHRYEFSRSL